MATNLYFCIISSLALICISVNCLPNILQKSIHLTYEQDAVRHSSLSRFRRQTPVLGHKNYVQAAAVQPSVVVMLSGVPNTVYRGVPGSPYGVSGASYGVQGSSYGVNRVPTVVVNMPDDNYITPVVNSPYVVPSTRL